MASKAFKTERGIITFFDLEQFGLYKIKHGKDHELVESNLKNVLDNLREWTSSKSVEDSVPWGNDNNRRIKAFCKNVSYDEGTGDFLFVIWKTLGDNDGNVQGIEAKSKVDETTDNIVSASETQDGKRYIWGLPCYYWVMPEHNKIASIRFPSSYADTDLFCQYIKAYVDFRMAHPNKKVTDITRPRNDSPDDAKYKRVTYSQGDNDSLVFKVVAKQTRLITGGANIEELCKKITHIVYHDVIETSVPDTREQWQKLFSAVGGVFKKSSPILSQKHRVELLVEGSPSPEEFHKLIEEYLSQHEMPKSDNSQSEDTDSPVSKEDSARIGFRVNGKNGSTTWLDEYVCRHEIHTDLSHRNKHYSSYYLMSIVKAHRDDVIKQFKKEEEITTRIEANDPDGYNDDQVNIENLGG
ncbi:MULTISPECIES: hypothetical protein [Pectobacterium]|uniref:hypothetical protein n=1 Tax=Pectobacterium TaxID=122277 RepID=UPI001E4519B1|nr:MULTISPECIES: hypothetical protein [Pectobacterium]GKW31360.1 hypothetical protein PEC730217_01400 [Pectobacterium carotovorum subsp. carotovorum]